MSRSIVTLALVAAAACRPMPEGAPKYPVYEEYRSADDLEGPFPYVEGEPRLSFGVFYEGGFSEEIPIDDTVTHYYIYETTYTQAPSSDRIEGTMSDALTVRLNWLGGGIVWDAPRDLSAWTTLHASFKSDDALFEDLGVQIESPAGLTRRIISDYGFVADGEWHSIAIPLEDFAGVNFSQVDIPISFLADTASTGSVVLVDDVYYTQE